MQLEKPWHECLPFSRVECGHVQTTTNSNFIDIENYNTCIDL